MESDYGCISDIADINPEVTNRSWLGRSIHYIDISSVGVGKFKSPPSQLSYEEAPSRARRVVRHGDILLSMVRPNRRSIIQILNPAPNTVASTGFAVLRPKRVQDSFFLFGLVMNKQFSLELEMLAYGAAYPAISVEDIVRPTVYVPSEENRDQISKILELLFNRNQTSDLDTMKKITSAIFWSWFVEIDCDKPRLKYSNKDVQHKPRPNLNLTKRPIPDGWIIGELSQWFNVQRGLSYSSDSLCDENNGVPMINLASHMEGGGYKASGIKHYSGACKKKHFIEFGDVLFSTLEQTHDLSLVGSPLIVPSQFNKTSIFSQDLLRARPKDERAPGRGFLFEWSKLHRMNMALWASGTTINRIPPAALERFPILVPDKTIAGKFEDIFECLWAFQENMVAVERKLEDMQDVLLPVLLSGRLDRILLGPNEN